MRSREHGSLRPHIASVEPDRTLAEFDDGFVEAATVGWNCLVIGWSCSGGWWKVGVMYFFGVVSGSLQILPFSKEIELTPLSEGGKKEVII